MTGEQPLDPAIVDLPADRPFVLAGFGSNAHSLPATGSELMRSTVDALGSLPVRAVAVLGSEQAVAAWTGPRPANVHLASFAPQRSLLACDLFLTYAGFGGVREALSAGVPMVAVPLFAEQPENAARVHGLGLGLHSDPTGLTADVLARPRTGARRAVLPFGRARLPAPYPRPAGPHRFHRRARITRLR